MFSGVMPPFAWWSQRSAASGHCTARELQAHTAWPEGKGDPVLSTRFDGLACHLCTRPSLHSSCTTQCTFLFEPRVTSSGCQPTVGLTSQSHSASRWGAPSLMLGCFAYFLRPASRAHRGHPLPRRVLICTTALHLYPQWRHLQAASIALPARTPSGVCSPLASQSHSSATSG